MPENNEVAKLDLNETLLFLAREVAWELTPLDTLKKKYGLSSRDWEKLSRDKRFNDLLASERADWLAADNTHKRVSLKSAAIVEIWLTDLYSDLTNNAIPFSQRVEAGKFLAKMANMGENKSQLSAAVPSGAPSSGRA